MRCTILCSLCFLSCSQLSETNVINNSNPVTAEKKQIVSSKQHDEKSWLYFLQNLPMKDGPILDYKGNAITNQQSIVQ